MNRIFKTIHAALLSVAMLAASDPSAHAAGNGKDQGTGPPSWAQGQAQFQRAQLEAKVQRLQAEPKAKGYDVARGSTQLFTIADCQYAVAVPGNRMDNNPVVP